MLGDDPANEVELRYARLDSKHDCKMRPKLKKFRWESECSYKPDSCDTQGTKPYGPYPISDLREFFENERRAQRAEIERREEERRAREAQEKEVIRIQEEKEKARMINVEESLPKNVPFLNAWVAQMRPVESVPGKKYNGSSINKAEEEAGRK